MTPELLSSIAGVILSLLASYLPGFSAWFNGLSPINKRLLMLGFIALTALGSYGIACADLAADFGIQVQCSQSGAIQLLNSFIAAMVANQAVFALSPKKEEEQKPSSSQFPL